ncbi:MAG: YigZ family protein [Roseburia sp.]
MRIVYKGGEGEVVEKKSRFLATVRPIASEEEATAFVAEMKKKYWDARHNCSAFVLGERHEISRCSDDGEPPQTAGRPMLEILLKEDIHNAAVVVTRYFGGILLGTGGLVRAYQKAVQAGLANSVIMDKEEGLRLTIGTDYNGLGKLQYLLAQSGLSLLDTVYTDKVELLCVVPTEQQRKVESEITEATNGAANLVWGEKVWYGMLDKKIHIFEKNT